MLPMYLAPSAAGGVRPALPVPLAAPERTGQGGALACAAEVAVRFWDAVAAAHSIESKAVQEVARVNRDAVARFARTFR
jgi:hypothetical protein